MDIWRLIAERKIQEAMEEGAFDELEGSGQPLDLSEDPYEDPADRMAHRLLKNNGFAPEWIEEAKEIEAESRRLRTRVDSSSSDFQRQIAELNRKIEAFNLKVPTTNLHKRRFE